MDRYRIKPFALIVLILLVLAGCSKKDSEKANLMVNMNSVTGNSNECITMVINLFDNTNCFADLSIVNDSDSEVRFGEEFCIQRKEKDSWTSVEYVSNNICWNVVAFPVDPKGSLECTVHWESIYGTLEAGTYRLIKDYVMGSEKDYEDQLKGKGWGDKIGYCVCEFKIVD